MTTFRDQSNVTAAKFNVIKEDNYDSDFSEPLAETAQDPSTYNSDSLELVIAAGDSPFTKPLGISLENQAIGYFFSNYVFSEPSFQQGYNWHLPHIFNRLSADSPLSSAIASVGLAGIANTRNSRDAQSASTVQYAAALHGVNAALRSPVEATADETLITVLLLGLYEVGNTAYVGGSSTDVAAAQYRTASAIIACLG